MSLHMLILLLYAQNNLFNLPAILILFKTGIIIEARL